MPDAPYRVPGIVVFTLSLVWLWVRGYGYQSASFAFMNSRLRRAMLAIDSFLGHTASQARVLVQLPKPSSSIFITMA